MGEFGGSLFWRWFDWKFRIFVFGEFVNCTKINGYNGCNDYVVQ